MALVSDRLHTQQWPHQVIRELNISNSLMTSWPLSCPSSRHYTTPTTVLQLPTAAVFNLFHLKAHIN